jgi:hypothetical protein
LVVEPWAITRLPFQTADHAEFGAAATRHMVAPLVKLNHGRAVEASPPPFFLSDFDKPLRSFILWAFPTGMPFAVTGATYLRSTPTAFAIFPTGVGSTSGVNMNLGGLDPFAATLDGAVYPVLSCILLIFLVPLHFETRVEEFFDVFQGNVILSAALRRHVLWISDRHCKDPTEA